MKKIIIIVNGECVETFVDKNKTLLQVLLENNIEIKSNCEGNGVCGKCHIKIDKEHYDKLDISDFEFDTLEKQINLTPLSRLACQIKMVENIDGMKIEIV